MNTAKQSKVHALVTAACNLCGGALLDEHIPNTVREWASRGARYIFCEDRQHTVTWNRTGGYPMITGPELSAELLAAWEPIKWELLTLALNESVRIRPYLLLRQIGKQCQVVLITGRSEHRLFTGGRVAAKAAIRAAKAGSYAETPAFCAKSSGLMVRL